MDMTRLGLSDDDFDFERLAPLDAAQLHDWNARYFKARFTRALLALVSSRQRNDRVHATDLRNKLFRKTGEHWDAKIRRYLRLDATSRGRPGFASAWILGELLRTAYQIEWMSGLWMIYIAGRLDDFVGIIREFIEDSAYRDESATHEDIESLWSIVASIGSLVPDRSEYIDACRKARLDWSAFIASREARLAKAFERWKTNRQKPRNADIIDGGIAVAQSPLYDAVSKEIAILKIIEQSLRMWLDSDDIVDCHPFEKPPPPRYWQRLYRGRSVIADTN